MDNSNYLDCEIVPENDICVGVDNTNVISREYTGVDTDDVDITVDNSEYTISVTIKPTWVNSVSDLPEVGSANVIYGIRNDSKFAVWDSANSEYAFFGYVLTATEKTKLGTLIEMLDNDQFGNVDDVKVDNNSVVDANKIAQFLTINGNYNASTNKLATQSDLPTLTSDLTNDGDGESPFATEAYVQENGGKIDSISVNNTTQTIDANKNVNLTVPTNVKNSAAANSAMIGVDNIVSGQNSLAVGYDNESSVDSTSSIVTGSENEVDGENTAIVGGFSNVVNEDSSGILSGRDNKIDHTEGPAGEASDTDALYSAIVGGQSNTACFRNSATVGGTGLKTWERDSTVVGRHNNPVSALFVVGNGNNLERINSEAFVGKPTLAQAIANQYWYDAPNHRYIVITDTMTQSTYDAIPYIYRLTNTTTKSNALEVHGDGSIITNVIQTNGAYDRHQANIASNTDNCVNKGNLAVIMSSDNATIGEGSGRQAIIASKTASTDDNDTAIIASRESHIITGTATTTEAAIIGGYKNTNKERRSVIVSGREILIDHTNGTGGDNSDALYSAAIGGQSNVVRHRNSVAVGGIGLKTGARDQLVAGRNNVGDADALFEVGDGDDTTHRSNAFEVLDDGRAKVRTAPVEDNDVVRKSDMTTAISNAIANVYKVQGSETVSNLNSATKSESMNGYVYNVSVGGALTNYDSSTLTVIAGDNVLFVWNSGTWYWDKLASDIDLSGYVQKTRTIAGVDLQDNVTKSELLTALNVEDGAEVNAIESISVDNVTAVPDANKNVNIDVSSKLAAKKGTGAPTTSTVADFEGQLYKDTTNDKIYICDTITEDTSTNPSTFTYTWAKLIRGTDYATTGSPGIVQLDAYCGIGNPSGSLGGIGIVRAQNDEIDAKTNGFKPIVPSTLNYAVKSALTANNHLTMTSAEQETAQSVLGIEPVQYGLLRWDE